GRPHLRERTPPIMAEIFRPVYYVDPATGKRVKKSFPSARKRKSKNYWIRYYLPGGHRRKVKGYPDRKATESYATELERRAQRVDGGFADALDEQARKPLAQHAGDFRRYLAAKGNTPAYVQLTMFRLTAMLDECRFVRIADIQASPI